jgi:aspartyl-tRNA(Asn)/glutamyl-tRNA(Gln) amidotransferase subunit A
VVTGWDRLAIAGLSRAYLSGQLSPSAVLDDALARIASMDGELSSFVAIDADRARRAAGAAEEELKNGRWRGQLHGVPIAVKELFDVENLPATYGSQARAGVVAAADSEVVRRLRRTVSVRLGAHSCSWISMGRRPR